MTHYNSKIKFYGNHIVKHYGGAEIGCGIDANLSNTKYMTNGINSLDAIAKAMGKSFLQTVNMRQMHSAKAVFVQKFEFLSQIADGIVTRNPELLLCIRTADCAPVLFKDYENEIIGAADVGWHEPYPKIIANTVNLMVKHGAKRNNIKVFLGPMLCKESFEYKEEMRNKFVKENPKFRDLFDGAHFDFPKFIKYHLNAVDLYNITCSEVYREKFNSPIDTYSTKEYNRPVYHSYRRAMHQNQAYTGHNCSCISL